MLVEYLNIPNPNQLGILKTPYNLRHLFPKNEKHDDHHNQIQINEDFNNSLLSGMIFFFFEKNLKTNMFTKKLYEQWSDLIKLDPSRNGYSIIFRNKNVSL